MTIGEHLEELRRRTILGLLAFAAAFALCWIFRDALLEVVVRPHVVAMRRLGATEKEMRLLVLTYLEAVLCYLKVCGVGALLLGGPVLLWQLWRFVSAGLYGNERRVVMRYFPASVGLFLLGALFGYFVLIPTGLYFLASMAPALVAEMRIHLDSYLGLFFVLTFALGGIFQLPLGMLALSRVGLFSAAGYRSKRKWFVLIAVVAAALLTPGPDPISQILLAIPMLLLYEVGILLAGLGARRRLAPSGAGEA